MNVLFSFVGILRLYEFVFNVFSVNSDVDVWMCECVCMCVYMFECTCIQVYSLFTCIDFTVKI